MADLDDFFKKKDKKKSKPKPKFLTAEELVKNLEDTSKREALKPKKESVPTSAGAENNLVNIPDTTNGDGNTTEAQQDSAEEEWKEFEVEERKDYSGLKIGQLQISDDDQNQQSYGENEEYGDDEVDSDGNTLSEMKRGGPWKKVIPAEEVTQIEKPPVSKIYISPALRQSNMMGPLKSKARNRNAPDITNEDFFPSLGAARPEEQRKKKNEPAFEEVRHGSRLPRMQEQPAAPVSVGNRFKSLAEDDS